MDISFTLNELKKAGLTQKQIGAAIGVAQPTISEMRKGRSGIIRPSSHVVDGLKLLAQTHGVLTEPAPPPKRRTRPAPAPT